MGFWESLGKGIAYGTGKLALGAAELTGHTAMGATGAIGKSLLNQFDKSAFKVAGAALTGAAVGGILADQDHSADPGNVALKGAALGLGASALGGSGLVSGLGVAAAGAGIMGLNAFGTVGSSMLRPMTRGEKAAEILSANKKATAFDIAAAGGKVGSKEAMTIGAGNLGDFKLRKGLAVPLVVGASAIKGINDGVRAFEQSRMGTNDGMLRKAAPIVPITTTSSSGGSYANNAGATGDLVFSMYKNR